MSYEQWNPKLNTGFFFIGDSQFYLYGSKTTVDLAEAKFYQWTLGVTVENIVDITVLSTSGRVLPEDIEYSNQILRIRSNVFSSTTDQVVVEYTQVEVQSGKVVQVVQTPLTLSVASATEVYYLNPVPVMNAPVIFTNDVLAPSSGNRLLHDEFFVDDEGLVTFFDTPPLSGTFEYETSELGYTTLSDLDLNPLNTIGTPGMLSIENSPYANIDPELY